MSSQVGNSPSILMLPSIQEHPGQWGTRVLEILQDLFIEIMILKLRPPNKDESVDIKICNRVVIELASVVELITKIQLQLPIDHPVRLHLAKTIDAVHILGCLLLS